MGSNRILKVESKGWKARLSGAWQDSRDCCGRRCCRCSGAARRNPPDARSRRILHQTANHRHWIGARMHDHSVMWREACIAAIPASHLLQGTCVSYPAAQALRPSYQPPGACPLLPALSLTCRCFFSGLSGLGGRRKQETSQPPPGVPSSSCSCACGADHRCEPRTLAAA